MNKQEMERWYQEECRKAGQPNERSQASFQQKWVAFTLLMSVPVGLSGCGSPVPGAPNNAMNEARTMPASTVSSSPSSGPLTAYDQCMGEKETYGWDVDCGDSNDGWYRSRGYTTKHSYVSSSSPYYKKMRGTAPSSSPSSGLSRQSGTAKTGSDISPSSSNTRVGGVGSGGTRSGGFSVGG